MIDILYRKKHLSADHRPTNDGGGDTFADATSKVTGISEIADKPFRPDPEKNQNNYNCRPATYAERDESDEDPGDVSSDNALEDSSDHGGKYSFKKPWRDLEVKSKGNSYHKKGKHKHTDLDCHYVRSEGGFRVNVIMEAFIGQEKLFGKYEEDLDATLLVIETLAQM